MSVTARGGYQIVDGAGARFVLGDDNSVDSIKIPGIYEKALNQLNKPCYFGGVSVDDDGTIFTIPFQVVVFIKQPIGLSFLAKSDNGDSFTFLIDKNDDTLNIQN